MNKLRNAFLILSASAFLASCGSPAPEASSSSAAVSSATSSASQPVSSSEPGSSAKSAESSSAASTQDFPDNVTISFWSTGSQGMNDTLTELVEVFEKAIKDNTGKTVHVDLSVEGGYDDIENKLITGLSDGTLPNMAVAYPDTVANIIAQEPANKEYLYDISSYLEDDTVGFGKQSYLGDTASADKEDIVPAFLDEGTHYSRPGMYSYPFMKSTEVMFYMKDYVESAYKFFRPEIQGAENIHDDLSNMTWAEFETLLTSVMDHKDAINDQLQTAAWYDSDSNWFISHCYQRGINYSSIENGKGKIGFESGVDRADAEAMLEDFKSLYDDQRITTKGIENKYGSDAFKNEWTLFSIGSSGGTGYQMPQGATPDEIGVVPVPAADGNQAYVSQGPTITFIKNPTLTDAENDAQMFYAWQFAKFLTNTDNNVEICTRGSQGYVPIRYSSYETREFTRYLNGNTLYAASGKVVIEEIAGHYYNAPVFPGSAQLRDAVGAAVPYVLKGEKTATKALQDAIDLAKGYMD